MSFPAAQMVFHENSLGEFPKWNETNMDNDIYVEHWGVITYPCPNFSRSSSGMDA